MHAIHWLLYIGLPLSILCTILRMTLAINKYSNILLLQWRSFINVQITERPTSEPAKEVHYVGLSGMCSAVKEMPMCLWTRLALHRECEACTLKLNSSSFLFFLVPFISLQFNFNWFRNTYFWNFDGLRHLRYFAFFPPLIVVNFRYMS